MSTITFQVDLSTRTGTVYGGSSGSSNTTINGINQLSSYGSWPDLAGGLGTATSNAQYTSRSVWLPINNKNDNRRFKHYDVFTVSGTDAYYLKQEYAIAPIYTPTTLTSGTTYNTPGGQPTGQGGGGAPPSLPGENQILRIINEVDGSYIVAGGNPGVAIALNGTTVVQAGTANAVTVAQPWVVGANAASSITSPSANQAQLDQAPVTLDQLPFNNPAMGHIDSNR